MSALSASCRGNTAGCLPSFLDTKEQVTSPPQRADRRTETWLAWQKLETSPEPLAGTPSWRTAHGPLPDVHPIYRPAAAHTAGCHLHALALHACGAMERAAGTAKLKLLHMVSHTYCPCCHPCRPSARTSRRRHRPLIFPLAEQVSLLAHAAHLAAQPAGRAIKKNNKASLTDNNTAEHAMHALHMAVNRQPPTLPACSSLAQPLRIHPPCPPVLTCSCPGSLLSPSCTPGSSRTPLLLPRQHTLGYCRGIPRTQAVTAGGLAC